MNIARLDLWVREKEGIKILDRKAVEGIQLEKLNRLLEREHKRQGFYRNLPRHLESLEELETLPFTTEKELKEQGNSMVLVSQSEIERVRSWETSGTTGPAKRVFYTAEDNERTVSFFAAGLSELIHPGEKSMIAMPFTGDRGLGELIQEAVEGLGAVPVPAGNMKSFGEMLELLDEEKPENSYPNTFVPGRNMIFLTFAAILAQSKNIFNLVAGVSEADFSGYPDCRDTFIRSLNVTLNLAMDEQFVIHTPLMNKDKSEVWELADQLNVFDLIKEQTLTCYNGIIADGCGHCPACKLRKAGLEKYLARKQKQFQ